MTEKKTPEKKVATKKVVAKKIEVEEVKAINEVTEKPIRVKKAQVDRNELIPCRSMTTGTLVYISDRTRARFIWSDLGTVQYVEMGELLDMRASSPKFLNDVMLIVEDDDAVNMLGLEKKYENLEDLTNLDDFFDKPVNEMAEILPKLPKGVKQSLANRARALIESGELDGLNTIRAIEEGLNIELKMFAD